MKKIGFTDEMLHSIPLLGKGQHNVFEDAGLPGLKMVIFANRKFFVHIPRLGDPRYKFRWVVGEFPAVLTEEAREAARCFNANVAKAIGLGGESGGDRSGKAAGPTLADTIADDVRALPMRRHNKRTAGDQQFIKRNIQDRSVNLLLDRAISDITVADARSLIEAIARRRDVAKASSSLVKLRTMCNWAMRPERRDTYRLYANPFAQITGRYRIAVEERPAPGMTS